VRILLGNTGRGGEQCFFTAIVHMYRTLKPDAFIRVASPPHYESLWARNKDIDDWADIKYEPNDKWPMDPINAYREYMQEQKDNFDIIEYASECVLQASNTDARKSTLFLCWLNIKQKLFDFDHIIRKVHIDPTKEDVEKAQTIAKDNPNIILLSHGANSMVHFLTTEAWGVLAKELLPYGTPCFVATSGGNHMPADPDIPNAVSLRDVGYGALFELRKHTRFFIGMETAPSTIVSESDAPMVILRGDSRFPAQSTSLIANGFRDQKNTYELDVAQCREDAIIQKVMTIVKDNFNG